MIVSPGRGGRREESWQRQVSGEHTHEQDQVGADSSDPVGVDARTDGSLRPFVEQVELGRAEALRLLAGAPLGRIVFTRHALPAIRPVNHIVEQGDIIIRIHEAAALSQTAEHAGSSGVVVAYEADSIDPDTRLGWSVVVTGYAQLIADPAEAARYQRLLHPWLDQDTDYTVRIRPNLVTGYRLVPAAATEPTAQPMPAPVPSQAPAPASLDAADQSPRA